MKKMHLTSLFFLSLIIFFVQSAHPDSYRPTFKANLTQNLEKLTYSHNQRLLVGCKQEGEGEFYVFDGLRLNNMITIEIEDQNKQRVSPSVFAFSKNDDLLIVGSKQGGIYGFKIINNIISTKYDYSYPIGLKNQQNWIRAISFSTQNKIAISAKTSLIIFQRQQSTGNFVQLKRRDFDHTIYALAWSVLEPHIVIIGSMSSSNGQFSLYDIQKNDSLLINKDKTQSLAIFSDGKTILKGAVGKNVEIFTYQEGALPVLTDTLDDTNDSKQILVSDNGLYFALKTGSGQVKAWTIKNEAFNSNLKNQQSIILTAFQPISFQQGKSFALSSSGSDIVIIPSDGSAQVSKLSLCKNQQFFNKQTYVCQTCSQNCYLCFQKQVCISCNPDRFIAGDQCKLCGSKLDGCLTCSSSEMCITCNQDQKWKAQANKEGKCQCMETFYNDNGSCQTCEKFLDCLTCSGKNYCEKCKDQGNFSTEPQKGLCVCKPSFWLNQTQCLQCSQSITDCQYCSQDGTKCTQCKSPDRKPNEQQQKCVCIDFKYQDQQTKKCEFCDLERNCVTCQPQQPHKCLTCDTNKHFRSQAVNGKCLCEAQYFFDEQQQKCIKCSDVMLDCQLCVNKDQCLICKDEKNFNTQPSHGKCVCNDKWILVGQICQLCSNQINGCLTCSSQTKCEICNFVNHFDKTPVDGECKCMPQYWLNDKVCQLCSQNIPGCSTCSEDGSKCFTCQDEFRQPSEDGLSCQCKPFYYQNIQNKTCQPCDPKHSCVQCQPDNDHECKICDKNGHWNSTPVGGKCQCMDGYNEYDGKCVFCMVPGCTVCPSQNTCEQCSQEKKFQKMSVQNKCECKSGTRLSDNGSQCVDCNMTILGCIQCSNAHNCQLCDQDNHFVIDPTNDICLCDSKGWYLKDNKCESCLQAIDNCMYCSVVNTNTVLCNKCEKGYGITSTNKSCVSCKSISPGCVNCDESNKCKECDQQNGFVLNGTKCACTKGYYLKGDQCTLCSVPISGCKQCDDENTCTSCNPDDKFVPQPNDEHKCSCITGWTLDQGKCAQCSVITGCLQCSNLQTCTKCDQNSQFQPSENHKCQCKKGYWIDQGVCKQCNQKIPGCQTCSQDGETCQKCSDPNKVLNDKKNQCICQQFMFQNSQNKCQYCDQKRNCKQCTQKDNCKICDTTKRWIDIAVQGKCVCENGYQQWNNSCLLCQVNGCQQCHEEDYCFKCSTEKRFNDQPVDGQCQCKQNTHLDGEKCYECGQKMIGCQQCDNLNQCKVCNDKNYFVLNTQTNLCQCDKNHYFVSPDCIACSFAIDYCSECRIDDDNKQCIKCQGGYTLDTENKTNCLSCSEFITGCAECSDDKTCTKCDQKNNFQPLENSCVCRKGFFLQEKQCKQCAINIPGCMDCDDKGEKCSSCDEDNKFFLNNDTGRCDCIKGFYLNGLECEQCESILVGCAECSSNGSQCNLCKDGFYLIEGRCMQCSTKVPGCTKCSSDGQQCQQCQLQHFFFNKTTGKCNCQQTYFLDEFQCKLCSGKLLSCNKCNNDGTECLQCMGKHFVLNNDSKQCQCESNFYVHENKTCQLCSQVIIGCSQCDQQGQKCSLCKKDENFILNDTLCSCIDGFYLNKQEKSCDLCSTKIPGSTKCSANGQQSLQCNIKNFILNRQQKKCQCIDGYFIASSTQCKLCSQGIQYCEVCSSSSSNMMNLHESFVPKCLQCQTTFTLNTQGTQCLCEGENKEIINGMCKQKQQQTNWIFYGAIAGGALIAITIGIFIYLKIKKSKLVRLDSYNQLDEEQNTSKSAKPETILTDGTADKIVFRSSVYKLEDEE